MNMIAASLTVQEFTQESAPLISVDKFQSVQNTVENTGTKENNG